jgi:serine/threonine protein kinase
MWRTRWGSRSLEGGGRYRLVDRLSEDPLGAVWSAEDLQAGRPVTVRVLRDDLVAEPRFVRWLGIELRPVSLLRHPNVLEVLDPAGGDEGPARFVVMAPAEGETLAARLARDGALDPAEAEAVTRQIRDGLEAAHEIGLVHGGLSPDSVLLTPEGGVKLFDFGIPTAIWYAARHARGANGNGSGANGYGSHDAAAREPDLLRDARSLDLLEHAVRTGARHPDAGLGPFIDAVLADDRDDGREVGRGPSPDRRVAVGAIAVAAVVAASVGFMTLRSPVTEDHGSPPPASSPSAETPAASTGVAVPDVAGLSALEARRRLETRELVVAAAQPAEGPPGIVIGTEPPTGQVVPPGTGVTLLVGATPDRQDAP